MSEATPEQDTPDVTPVTPEEVPAEPVVADPDNDGDTDNTTPDNFYSPLSLGFPAQPDGAASDEVVESTSGAVDAPEPEAANG